MTLECNGTDNFAEATQASGRTKLVQHLLIAASFMPIAAFTVAVLIFRDDFEDFHTLGYVGIFLSNVIGSGSFILPVPGIATAILGATLWNPFLVAVAGATGSTLGEAAAYLAGAGSYDAVRRVIGRNRWYTRIKSWIETHGMITIFLFAAIPNPLFDVAGFAAGSTKYPINRFVAVCWLGKMVKYTVVSYAAFWGADVLYGWFD